MRTAAFCLLILLFFAATTAATAKAQESSASDGGLQTWSPQADTALPTARSDADARPIVTLFPPSYVPAAAPAAQQQAAAERQNSPVTRTTSHPNLLFGDSHGSRLTADRFAERPVAYNPFDEPTQPVQYPLDDQAYQGMPPPAQQTWATPALTTPQNYPAAPAAAIDEELLRWKVISLAGTVLAGDSSQMGMFSLDLRGTLEFPRLPMLFVTPQLGWHLLNGPSATDLPPRLYDASLSFSVYQPIGDPWLLQFTLAPSIFTDGDNTSSDAFRLLGRFLAFYRKSPTLQISGGLIYLGRDDIPVLPAFGVIYTPHDDVRYELLFPKPRIAWRASYTPLGARWVYVTGELGGGSWAVRRTTGVDDVATYGDLRLVFGLEQKNREGGGWYVEGGYVFGREIEFDSNVGNLSLNSTAFLRGGVAY